MRPVLSSESEMPTPTDPKRPYGAPERPLELWGGIESTVNRVGDTFFDQIERCGHLGRLSDLNLIRDLGLRSLRYPFHWERFARTASWQPFDDALDRMRQVGIDPIAGLVHHGSGPLGTDLLSADFAPGLADFALSVARRYPSLTAYTPVNEPQTTARFSGLYGHWYPHHQHLPSFVRALANQIKASVLSMRAVRSVRPDARFIHTEDAGKTWSTHPLEAECVEREHRRWLGLDLLTGRVDRHHPLFGFLLRNGLTETEILWFADNPCPPDVIGLNYYVTSDRFLDHRTGLYPDVLAGGDTGRDPFVDIEAVRAYPRGIAGSRQILTEAWDRYGLPVAITEAHLGGPVEDQILWLSEIWQGALEARAAGVNCVAVTVWALLGSWNWCHLVTRDTGAYEPGVFDVPSRSSSPAPTPLAALVRHLAAGGTLPTPDRSGWWSVSDRLLFPPETVEPQPEFASA